MIRSGLVIIFFALTILFGSQLGFCQEVQLQKQTEMAMRQIGHELLLASKDSTSRVLPIEKTGESTYLIQFENDFELNSDAVQGIVDTIFIEREIASEYVLEILDCDSGKAVYGYGRNLNVADEIMACGGRMYERSCYQMAITIIEPAIGEVEQEQENEAKAWWIWVLIGMGLTLGFAYIVNRTRKSSLSEDKSHLIPLGNYLFDKRNMELRINDEKMELTGKESDLLSLLHSQVNSTLERDVILNAVWGDEGDYVGRTLDVFISKLRKKLEGDDRIKIVNVRGVGYKLVLNS